MKQMSCSDIFRGFGIAKPEVLLDSQIVPDTSVVKILDPLLAYKLSVGNKGINTFGAEQLYKYIN